MTIRVREKPPLRASITVETPSGKLFRWGDDDPDGERSFQDLTWGDGIPGGFDSLTASLARRGNIDYADLEQFSTLRVYGAGGEVVGEYRLEDTPRTSGDQFRINPAAVGWQAALEDDTSASFIGIDRDFSQWYAPPPQYQLDSLDEVDILTSGSVVLTREGSPVLDLTLSISSGDTLTYRCTSFYDAGNGNNIGRIDYSYNSTNVDSAYSCWIQITAAEDFAESDIADSGDLATSTDPSGSGSLSAPAATFHEFASTSLHRTGNNQKDHVWHWTKLNVIGDHGLACTDGILASDAIAYILGRWAPILNVNATIEPTNFEIPQMAFKEKTTAAEMIRAINIYHSRPWAVWEDREFHYNARGGGRSRSWRTRVGPSQLDETGKSAERSWNGVIVEYDDPGGKKKSVGPEGSGCDDESNDLSDQDPDNPLNLLGLKKWGKIDMGTSTSAGAIQVGSRWLEDMLRTDRSGRATIVGWIEEASTGIMFPYTAVRSGDFISFSDAADPSPRYVIKTSKNHTGKSCSVDLDAPPDSIEALNERLGVVLVGKV